LKKVIVLLILFLLTLTSCSSIVNYSTEAIEINSVNTNVNKWVGNNSKTDGIYLGKTKESDKVVMYYLYVNYSCKVISIDSGGKDSIIIDAIPRQSGKKSDVIFCIIVKDTSFKKFILNGEDIKASAVSVIK